MPPEEICLASKSSTKSYVCSLTDIEKGAVSIDATFSPHLCVGFLFLILFPASAAAASSAASLSHTTLSPTVFHTQLCHPPSFTHTTLSPTIFHTHNFVTHTQLCHTSSFTHNFVTHHLSHTTLSPTICHTHNFVTHHLSHTTLSHTTLSHTHTQLCHTQLCHTQLCDTQICHPSFTHNFVTHHLSQLCHTPSFTHNFVTHLSHTTLSHTIFHNFVTNPLSHTTMSSIFHITAAFAWQAWHLWHWAGSGGALGLGLVAGGGTLRGRRGTWRHPPSFCVAGVALGDIHLRFAWQAWHLWHWAGSGGALGLGLVAGDAAALCVASVALGDTHLRFTWQVWRLETSTSFCLAVVALMALGWLWWRAWAGITLRGRRCTWRHPPSFHVAGVALGDIHLRFAWQP